MPQEIMIKSFYSPNDRQKYKNELHQAEIFPRFCIKYHNITLKDAYKVRQIEKVKRQQAC